MKVLFYGGWAVPQPLLRSIWERALPEAWQVHWVALDGVSRPGPAGDVPFDLVAGWSLGGQKAVQLAAAHGCPVVTLGSGPRFVVAGNAQRQAWLAAFCRDFRQSPEKTLRRFALLLAQGAGHSREALREIQAGLTDGLAERMAGLSAGLQALAEQDLTAEWAATSSRRLSIVFGQDAVFPCEAPDAATVILPGGHLPDADQCRRIRTLLETHHGH